jgi:hypothetical protein
MSFIVPVAEASVKTLIQSIDKVIINPIILFLFAVAVVYFLYGLAQYLLSPDNEEVRKSSKSHMMWGIIGLFIMVAVFGIMKILLNTVGENKIKINNNGDFDVTGNAIPKDNTVKDSVKTGQDIFKPTGSDISSPTTSTLPTGTSYTTNPFKKKYVESAMCWHSKDLYVKDSSEYKALQSIRSVARAQLLAYTHLSDSQISKDYPTVFNSTTLYDASNKSYYVWWDARAPINGGKDSDCNLAEVSQTTVLQPSFQSTKPNPLKNAYVTDLLYYRAVGSGINPTYTGARSAAIANALIDIAKQRGTTVTLSGSSPIPTVDFTYTVLPEEKYYAQDAVTGNYDYWLAIESKK